MEDQIVKYFLGELSSVEKRDLFRQINGDPEARKKFIGMQNTWALAATASSEYDPEKSRPFLHEFKKKQSRRKTRILFINLSKYAAILIVGMLIAGAIVGKRQQEKGFVAYQQLTVPAGQRSLLTLADGTTVWVNAKSTLVYPGIFNGDTREVTLIGEAYFDIAPDRKQPFIIKSGNFRTLVTGTKFNVFAYEGFFDVSILEGQVKIYQTGASDTIVLNRSDKVTWTNGRFEIGTIDNKDDFLWKEGIYYFDDMSFRDIVEKLELYYDVKMHVTNKMLLERKFTGKFRQRDGIESVLKVIQMNYSFTFTKSDDGNDVYIK